MLLGGQRPRINLVMVDASETDNDSLSRDLERCERSAILRMLRWSEEQRLESILDKMVSCYLKSFSFVC